MSARVLVVDDLAVNRRLMEARLLAEYYDVSTACDGETALALAQAEAFDLILLDVMMPGIDGFEVCRRLKARPETQHVPIVLLTALDQPDHRLAGLAAGADDFLTKPVGNFALLSRLRALTRLKVVTDEVRARLDIVSEAAIRRKLEAELSAPGSNGTVVVCTADPARGQRLRLQLASDHRVEIIAGDAETIARCRSGDVDVVLIDFIDRDFDPLRLCSQLRSSGTTRRTPILLIADQHDEPRIERGMEIGASDFVTTPIDPCELAVRVRTQVRRRRFDDTLRSGVRQSAELAVRDPLTELYNRRFLDSALIEAIEQARKQSRALSVLIADLDHFKQINDRFGHDVGDRVLKAAADRMRETIRATDIACRFGGEEFVVLMLDADDAEALRIGERLRASIAASDIAVDARSLRQTVSVGVATFGRADDGETLLKRADRGLYEAKDAGRNRVVAIGHP